MVSDTPFRSLNQQLRVWEYQRADGYVFHCDLTDTVRDWMLTLACNGCVFARHAFDSRPQAEAWAADFWSRLNPASVTVSTRARLRAA